MEENEMIVTPWEVSGVMDYGRLIQEFGTEPLTTEILEYLKKHTVSLHLQLRRKIFFSHRDLAWILQMYESGNRFALYTGRGPSGPVHIGHLVPWIFTRHLQKEFGSKLYFQMTDDEKFLVNQNLTIDNTKHFMYENILDVIALGFDPKKTFIISDIENQSGNMCIE